MWPVSYQDASVRSRPAPPMRKSDALAMAAKEDLRSRALRGIEFGGMNAFCFRVLHWKLKT